MFRPVTENVAVEVGWTHLIDLTSCQSLFDAARFHLFWGKDDRVDVVPGPLELSDIEHLTRFDLDLEQPAAGDTLELAALDPVGVAIELSPTLTPSRRVVAALIPLEQGAWLKRLVYFLPETSLRGHRVAVTDRGILLVASPEVDVIPLGMLLCELAPGLLVPLGMDLAPRVAPEVLAKSLGHGAGIFTVFAADGRAFQVPDSALEPLERRVLARVDVSAAQVASARVERSGEPAVVNEPVGRFALWGFRAPPQGE